MILRFLWIHRVLTAAHSAGIKTVGLAIITTSISPGAPDGQSDHVGYCLYCKCVAQTSSNREQHAGENGNISMTWCLWLCSLIRAIKALKSRILSHLPFYGCDLDWS